MLRTANVWNEIFARQGRTFFEPHEDMPGIVRLLKAGGASTILDLGSGTGRHVVYLASNGFSIMGLDNSPEGIKATSQWLVDEGITAELRLQNMTERFPCENASLDAVVSVQVIRHADTETIKGIVAEVYGFSSEEGSCSLPYRN